MAQVDLEKLRHISTSAEVKGLRENIRNGVLGEGGVYDQWGCFILQSPAPAKRLFSPDLLPVAGEACGDFRLVIDPLQEEPLRLLYKDGKEYVDGSKTRFKGCIRACTLRKVHGMELCIIDGSGGLRVLEREGEKVLDFPEVPGVRVISQEASGSGSFSTGEKVLFFRFDPHRLLAPGRWQKVDWGVLVNVDNKKVTTQLKFTS